MNKDENDEALLLKACKGDENAFKSLYDRHRGALYRFLLRQCNNQSSAHDLFQEVWESIWKGCERYTVKAKFTTYLFKIARYRVIDYYRRRSAKPSESFEDEHCPDQESIPDGNSLNCGTVEGSVAEADSAISALGALPLEQREAFLLLVEGYSIKDIADIMDVKKETVKSRIRYARNKLKQILRG